MTDHQNVSFTLLESAPSKLEVIVHKAEEITHNTREKWGKSVEFLLTCISMCVGLGNLWRFPFTALENGGGAFLVPYIIILFLIGKPVYFMEMLLGQFSSRGSVKVYDMAPIMRGVGYGQAMAMGIVSTYYASIMALTLKYFYESFNSVLPWTVCDPAWKVDCIPSGAERNASLYSNNSRSSSELYFV
jgi:solute carrier family 6 amino acid transporter-like protein 5/7/9/14